MVRCHEGDQPPPYERHELAKALSLRAATGKPSPVPLVYALDLLAQRWHIDPERLDDLDSTTVMRGLTFMALESQAVPRREGDDG
jgi:hypothetical protein